MFLQQKQYFFCSSSDKRHSRCTKEMISVNLPKFVVLYELFAIKDGELFRSAQGNFCHSA